MNRLNLIWQRARLLAVTASIWTAGQTTVWAQEAAKEPSSGGKAWALSYFLTIMGIALGMLVVCHMSRRRDRPKREQFED